MTQPSGLADAIDVQAAVNRLEAVGRRLNARYVGRERAVKLLQLAVICREHVLLLGPPGTAKTDLVMRFAELLDARRFSYLLTRFTEPTEIFGPLDLEAFRRSSYEVRVTGMLPDAQIAFLDEVFQGSSAILNALLSLINERIFHNGSVPTETPLITLVGAANELPEDPVLRAFADRFMLRVDLASVAESGLSDLLALGWEREQAALRKHPVPQDERPVPRETPMVRLNDVAALSVMVAEVDPRQILGEYQEVVRQLLAERVTLSDRRIVRGFKLVLGAAALRNADRAEPKDLWPLIHCWTDPADAARFAEIIQPRVEADGGEQLRTTRSARQILADAQYEFEQARIRAAVSGGGLVPSALERAMGRLQELYLELLRSGHTRSDTTASEIQQMIQTLLTDLTSTY